MLHDDIVKLSTTMPSPSDTLFESPTDNVAKLLFSQSNASP